MSDLFWLTDEQLRRIERHFPLSHGIPCVDDRRVISGIIFVIRNGLRWRNAPRDYGPHKTIYERFVRGSRLGVFNRIFAELSAKGPRPERLMIAATHLKAHRTAAGLLKKKGAVPRHIGRTKGGLNSKLHAVCDGQGQPLVTLLSEGQMSDDKGAALKIDALPKARAMLGDRGLRRRLVPRRPDRPGHRAMHPAQGQTQGPYRLRQDALPPAPQDREHVRPPQGLVPHPHPLRPMRPHLHVRHRHRRYRHLLAMINES